MKTITHTALGTTDIFEIVEEIPLGYSIWNIGENAPEGYLPLCRLSRHQPFPGGQYIETDTLKAIKVDGAQDILAAIGRGQNTLSEMKQYVKRYRNSKTDFVQRRVALYRKAIPIMQKIKGIENLAK